MMNPEKQTKVRSSPRAKRSKPSSSVSEQIATRHEQSISRSDQASSGDDRHARIAALAYVLYERYGCQAGRDVENWLEAERQVQSQERRTEN